VVRQANTKKKRYQSPKRYNEQWVLTGFDKKNKEATEAIQTVIAGAS
jgi:hypothetical protein